MIRRVHYRVTGVCLLLAAALQAQAPRKQQLALGTLYLPARMTIETPQPLVVFFHGAGAPELASNENRMAMLAVYFPTNSDPYVATFGQPGAFPKLIREAEVKSNLKFGPLILGCFSAGCGAVREILRDDTVYDKTRSVFAMDGVYADFVTRNQIAPGQMDVWLKLAKDSIVGRKRFLMTHTDVESDTYATAKQTADWLLEQMSLKRKPAARGAKGAPRTEAEAGNFLVRGFPGVESANHLDQLGLVSDFLRLLLSKL